jgi:uncharacterized membrane protein
MFFNLFRFKWGMIAWFGLLLACILAPGEAARAAAPAPSEPAAVQAPANLPELEATGKIVAVLAEQQISDPLSGRPVNSQRLKVRITSGPYQGKEVIIVHDETDNPVFNIKVGYGDSVTLALTVDQGRLADVYITDLLRQNYLYLLGVIFVILLLAVGWQKGAKALCSLILTLILIWGVLLPGILKGYSPVLLTILITFVCATLTLLVVGGWTLKSLAAILGTLSGVVIAGTAAILFGKAAHLTGFGSEEAGMLLYLPQSLTLDVQGLLFAGIIIGALGASMDVSISIASAVEEIKRTDPSLAAARLFRSGMNVGRDIMGTMSNTLILAYTGSSIQLILIFMAFGESYQKIINLDMVASEVVRAFAGSIGLIAVIPLTAVIAAMMFGGAREQGQPFRLGRFWGSGGRKGSE